MCESWPEYAIARTRRVFEENGYVARNGKIFFKKMDRTRGFMYEAELEKVQYRMHPIKDSHTFVEYESLDAMLEAGWAVESVISF